MRLLLKSNSIEGFTGTNYTNIALHNANNPLNVGIFWFGVDSYFGGWIDFPIPYQLTLEALSWSKRTLGRQIIIEITVDSLDKLLQLANALRGHHIDWKLPEKAVISFPLEKLLSEKEKEIDRFIKDVRSFIDEIILGSSLSDANNINWNEYGNKLSNYISLVSSKQLPPTHSEKFLSLNYKNSLEELYNDFTFNNIKIDIIENELLQQRNGIDELTSYFSLEKGKFTVDKLKELLSDVQEKMNDFNLFSTDCNRFGCPSEITKDLNKLKSDIGAIRIAINEELMLLKKTEKLNREHQTVDQAVVTQLKKLTPGIQTLLTRISELTSIDKERVEESIRRLLEKNPALGNYDKLSQVFIPGQQMAKEIDKLLKQYDEWSSTQGGKM